MAILLAVGVACLLAVSSLLQHGATQAVSAADAHGFALLGSLLRSRRWLAAKLFDVLALALEVVALSKGSLILFQTIVTSSVIIAIVGESWRAHRRLHKREIAGGVAIMLGARLVAMAHRQGPDVEVSFRGWFLASAVIAVVIMIGRAATRGTGTIEASVLAVGTGSCSRSMLHS